MINPKQQKRSPIKAQTLLETHITKRENGSTKVTLDFSNTTSLTQQEFLRESNINNIVKLPMPEQTPLSYGDLTDPPNLRRLFETIHTVKESFMQMPSDVRKLMDNDPAKMQEYVTNPKNQDFLISRGVLTRPEKPSQPPVKASAPSKDAEQPKQNKKP